MIAKSKPTNIDFLLTFLPIPYYGEKCAYKTIEYDLEIECQNGFMKNFNCELYGTEEKFKQSVINKRILLIRGMSYLSTTSILPLYEGIKYLFN